MREGACPCGAVRYVIDGPVRDVLVCHCDACIEATGGPWAASAATREDLVVAEPGAVVWNRARISEHDASRGSCRSCGTVIFWDAPTRPTVSFAAKTLGDQSQLEVVGHIWLGDRPVPAGPSYPRGLPAFVAVPWRR